MARIRFNPTQLFYYRGSIHFGEPDELSQAMTLRLNLPPAMPRTLNMQRAHYRTTLAHYWKRVPSRHRVEWSYRVYG